MTTGQGVWIPGSPPLRSGARNDTPDVHFHRGVCNLVVINPTPNGIIICANLVYCSPSSTFSHADPEIFPQRVMDMCSYLAGGVFGIRAPPWRFDDVARKARGARRSVPWRAAFLCLIAATIWVPNAGASALDVAAQSYRRYLIEDIGRALTSARRLRERIEARDFDGARTAWIEARTGWERSEVFTSGFVPDLDQKIDAWPNASHGFHGIEAALFGANPTDALAETREKTDALIAHLADLHAQLHDIALTPQRLLNGIARLAFEMGGSKADGGESRLSGTSLNDLQSNADGIELAYRIVFSAAVEVAAPQLADAAGAAVQRLKAVVQISALRNLDAGALRAYSEELVAILQVAAPEMGLDKPTLEEVAAQ